MKRSSILFGVVALVLIAAIAVYAAENSTWGQTKAAFGTKAPAPLAKGGGFDEFGYNYKARIFVGPADGIDRVLDG